MQEPGTIPNAEQIGDRMAISEILALHCRGVDRADEETLKSCYWPDATASYGPEKLPAHNFCENLAKAITGYDQTHHMVTNVLCAFDGDQAIVESALIAFHFSGGQSADASEMTYLGRYIDQFEKRGAVWKISSRTPVMSWTQNAAASHDETHPVLASLRQAKRYPDDAIFEHRMQKDGLSNHDRDVT